MKISQSTAITKTVNWRKRKGNFNPFTITHFQGYLPQDGGALPQAVDVLLLQIQITGIVNMYRVASLNYTSLRQELAGLSHWTGAGQPLSLDRGWPASLIGQGLASLVDRGWASPGLARLCCFSITLYQS